jgi:hypothetical protein
MPRLHRMVCVIAAATTVAACASVGALSSTLFYLDGVNRQDGMSVNIDAERGFIRLSSDRLLLQQCAPPVGRVCFMSEYMVFSSGLSDRGAEWIVNGVTFKDADSCQIASPRGSVVARRILSRQDYGSFAFYFSEIDHLLLGWSLTYVDEEKEQVDTWMMEGLSGGCQ